MRGADRTRADPAAVRQRPRRQRPATRRAAAVRLAHRPDSHRLLPSNVAAELPDRAVGPRRAQRRRSARVHPAPGAPAMNGRQVAVDVLVAASLAITVASVFGAVVLRTTFGKLHYLTPVT